MGNKEANKAMKAFTAFAILGMMLVAPTYASISPQGIQIAWLRVRDATSHRTLSGAQVQLCIEPKGVDCVTRYSKRGGIARFAVRPDTRYGYTVEYARKGCYVKEGYFHTGAIDNITITVSLTCKS